MIFTTVATNLKFWTQAVRGAASLGLETATGDAFQIAFKVQCPLIQLTCCDSHQCHCSTTRRVLLVCLCRVGLCVCVCVSCFSMCSFQFSWSSFAVVAGRVRFCVLFIKFLWRSLDQATARHEHPVQSDFSHSTMCACGFNLEPISYRVPDVKSSRRCVSCRARPQGCTGVLVLQYIYCTC